MSVLNFIRRNRSRSCESGQTLVEFALVLPLLIVLLLGIADFGRVFSAGITLEAAARNAAEAAAQEYLQLRRDSAPPSAADLTRIQDVAKDRVCDESKLLPNHAASGGACSMPTTAVCIHDVAAELVNYGSGCGAGAGAAPGGCTRLHAAWPATAPATTELPWVEVRSCYQFTTLFNLQGLSLPFESGLSLGDIWLQRDRTFTVADY
jgi:hypothetical protein